MITPLSQICIGLCGVQVFHTFVTIGLVRQFKELQGAVNDGRLARSELSIGTRAPNVSMTDIRTGQLVELDSSMKGRALLFLSPRCTFCIDIVQGLGRIPSDTLTRLVPICSSFGSECKSLSKRLPSSLPLLGDATRTLLRQYGIGTVPALVVVTPSGRIRGYAHPATWQDVMNVLEDASIDSEIDLHTDNEVTLARGYVSEAVSPS